MVSKTITREEFDARLAHSTEQVRRQERDTSSGRRDDLRNLLNELAERTSSVAASL